MNQKDPEKIVVEFNLDHAHRKRDCLFVTRLRENGLTTSQIASVIEAIDDTCNHCYDDDAGCQCSNDE